MCVCERERKREREGGKVGREIASYTGVRERERLGRKGRERYIEEEKSELKKKEMIE